MNRYQVVLKDQCASRVRFTLFVNQVSLGELETTEEVYFQMLRDFVLLNAAGERADG